MQRPTARHIFQRKDINCNVPLDSSPKSSGTKQKGGGIVGIGGDRGKQKNMAH